MSFIKLKTKEEIKDFFRILAEESVKEAKQKVFSEKAVFSGDPMASRISKLSADDKKAYDLKEEEEESSITVSASSDEPSAASTQVDDDLDVDFEVEESEPDIEDVSLDSVSKEINVLRGGRSLKDQSVQKALRLYFDQLDQAERKALLAFLTAVSSVMTGRSTGADAADPSDPPYNVDMTTGAEQESQSDDVNVEDDLAVDKSTRPAASRPAVEDDEDEDESVPIRVGSVAESGSVSKIRNKVQELLKRS